MEQRILDYMKTLPKIQAVCHGDFHPDNILITGQDAAIIDWTNAYTGNPLSDVARICLFIRTPFMPPGTNKVIVCLSKLLKNLLCSAYLKEYARLGNVNARDIDAWILPAAAARLSEKIPGKEKWLLYIINKRLKPSGLGLT